MSRQKRGLVFSLDAVFAIYIGIFFMTTYLLVLEPYYSPTSDMTQLHRVARDLHEARYYYRQGEVDVQMNPEEYGYTTACAGSGDVGASKDLQYASIRDYGYDDNVQNYVPSNYPIDKQTLMLYPYANKWLYAGLYSIGSEIWYTGVTQACTK